MVADWRDDYNEHRPHSSLGMKAPATFARDWRQRNGPPGDQAARGISLRSPSGLTARDTAATPGTTLQPNPDHRLSHQVDR
jgi:transposase InsO family protein